MLQKSGFETQTIRQETPALWLANSFIAQTFFKTGQPTKQLRNPLIVASLILIFRFLFFPLLWIGNRLGRGDCLVVVAKKS